MHGDAVCDLVQSDPDFVEAGIWSCVQNLLQGFHMLWNSLACYLMK